MPVIYSDFVSELIEPPFAHAFYLREFSLPRLLFGDGCRGIGTR